MLKGLGLIELAQKIEDNKSLKKDFGVDTKKIEMRPSDRGMLLDLGKHGEYPLLPLAHDQIGQRTGVPAKYYDRMLIESPQLLATNVNHWFHNVPEQRMVRTLGNNTRAFLSRRYQRIENEQIAEAALPVLGELPGVQIVSSEVTDRRLYIQFVVPTVEGEVRKGDIVQAGGIISNSEVGLGACSVAGLVWRLMCLNGMKTGEAFRRHHVGRAVEAGELDWSDETMESDDRTVLLKVRDMVKAVVDETRFKQQLFKLQGLTDVKITGNPAEAVEVLAQKVNATETEKGGILRSLIEGGDLSAWGVVNAVTAQAHNAVSYDRAVELETAGGSLVELAPSEWKRVLEAA